MACSAARMEANRRNAGKSTGPRTAEGKAVSRLNAFRHGMAGAGAVVGPEEDVALIEYRGAAFAREFAAEGEAGRLLAHRAAVLSVRMERAMVQDFAKVGEDVAAARERFDADRRALIAGWIAEVDEADDPRPALDELGATLEGQAHLAEAWLDLRARVAAGDAGAAARAATWLDRPGLAEPAAGASLLGRIDAEADRLLARIDATGAEELARIEAARDHAGVLASFDPAPDAQRARRYDADAERGMYRAFRALRQLRDDRAPAAPPARGPVAPRPPIAPAPDPVPPPAPAPPAGPSRVEPPGLGSIRGDVAPPPAEPPASREERRKTRPDLRKLARMRR